MSRPTVVPRRDPDCVLPLAAMSAKTNTTPLLDGPRRSIFLGLVMLVLVLMTADGLLTWLEAEDAQEAIDELVASDPERYPGGIDDTGQLLNAEGRAQIAAQTDGDRLDRDLITTKTWLAVAAVIAAIALTLASGPGSSRNILALAIVISAAAFFVPLVFHGDTIDIVTTAHGG